VEKLWKSIQIKEGLWSLVSMYCFPTTVVGCNLGWKGLKIMTAASGGGVWDGILGSIKGKLNNETFNTWFNSIRFEAIDDSHRKIRLRAPNRVVRDWVNANYASVVNQSLSEVQLSGYSLDWVLEEEGLKSSLRGVLPKSEQLPFKGPHASADSSQEQRTRSQAEAALNPKYTYDGFVVGSCNQFAHAASLAVAEAPGRTYNPLYLYGGVGLGKTHLMHACGNAIKERNPHLRLCYLSSEKFMNELINAIRYDKTQSFREKYRSVDVLLIDDVQFMAGKERTQEEFFHTFNSLYEQQKQIVISSDCPPREIPTLEERLHSRFEWGLIADLEPPDLETKVAILKRKAEFIGVSIPDDVALFIANRVKNNVRELEGSLVRLVAMSSLRGQPISKTLAQDAIRTIATEEDAGVITIQQIQKSVAASYRMSVDELVSKSNARQFSLPRQVAMFLCKKLTKHSYPEIGRAFGGKHHTTVIHSFEKIEASILTDATLAKTISDITESLQK
jgi:chromosomal replication initiator protein